MGKETDMDAAPTPDRLYSIGELAELTGVSRRTVRFYVQRRLIDAPLGRGRGSHYDQRHVEQIRRVRALQRQGVPLSDMAADGLAQAALRPGAAAGPPDVQPVVRVRIDQNVTVEVAQAAATPELVAALVVAARSVVDGCRSRPETRRSESEEKEEP